MHCDLSKNFVQAQRKLETPHTACAPPKGCGVTPLACAKRSLYQTLPLCVFQPCHSSPNKFCTFSRVICAQTVKKDLCLIICRKNHTTAFAPFVPLPSPFPRTKREAFTSSSPSSPDFYCPLSFLCSFMYFALFSLSYSLLSAEPMHNVYKDPQLKLVSDVCCSWGVFFSKLSSFHLMWR